MINHDFKKKFGQNFISDKNLISAICDDAGVENDDEVLEIGAGAGSLTSVLNERAKKVVSYEIDKDLQSHLLGLELDKAKFVFGDIMDFSIENIEKDFSDNYKMIANLPYYITTPIIFKFLNGSNKIKSLTIMVQKEVAERIVASSGGKDYGVLSVMIKFFGQAKITRIVSRKMFFPQPNVDSAVVSIQIENKYPQIDKEKFYKFIQNVFAMRRKTLNNNLQQAGYDKEKIKLLGEETLKARAEIFGLEKLIEIYNAVK
ncbi:MAG: ribosomal RNA small subunit methyltransferase A [Clostridiales bacterium]|nr:ribosomal RNA small subunit methyltransferase A [Clostridiales bacterium]